METHENSKDCFSNLSLSAQRVFCGFFFLTGFCFVSMRKIHVGLIAGLLLPGLITTVDLFWQEAFLASLISSPPPDTSQPQSQLEWRPRCERSKLLLNWLVLYHQIFYLPHVLHQDKNWRKLEAFEWEGSRTRSSAFMYFWNTAILSPSLSLSHFSSLSHSLEPFLSVRRCI